MSAAVRALAISRVVDTLPLPLGVRFGSFSRLWNGHWLTHALRRSRGSLMNRLQRLAIRLLTSLVTAASAGQVDLRIELHARGIVLQLPHPSEFSY